MHGVRAPDRCRRRFGQSQEPDLPGRHEPGHRADRLFDGHLGIDPVLIVKVDGVDLEPLQRGVACLAHVVGRAVDAEERPVLVADVAELRGNHALIAAALQRASEQTFVGEGAVDVCCVEEVHSDVQGAVDGGDRLAFIAAGVEIGHPHAAEPDGGHTQGGAAQLSSLHCRTFP
jgi:hypothetical protein